MAMGQRELKQQPLWLTTSQLPPPPAHPFYQKRNQPLGAALFDRYAEDLCPPDYAEAVGRPPIPPGVYFRRPFRGLRCVCRPDLGSGGP
jgi:transposase